MTLPKLKFIHPTVAQAMRLASIILAIANTILAYGATLSGLPSFLIGVSTYWPVIYGVAIVLHTLASTCGLSPDAAAQAQLSDAVADAKLVLAAFESAKTAVPRT